MKQREVTDNDSIRWTCVQAYTALKGQAAEKATELSETDDGKVQVVCTPAGGAKTVRLDLGESWDSSLSDEQLLDEIFKGR
jgi:hypothetical protein